MKSAVIIDSNIISKSEIIKNLFLNRTDKFDLYITNEIENEVDMESDHIGNIPNIKKLSYDGLGKKPLTVDDKLYNLVFSYNGKKQIGSKDLLILCGIIDQINTLLNSEWDTKKMYYFLTCDSKFFEISEKYFAHIPLLKVIKLSENKDLFRKELKEFILISEKYKLNYCNKNGSFEDCDMCGLESCNSCNLEMEEEMIDRNWNMNTLYYLHQNKNKYFDINSGQGIIFDNIYVVNFFLLCENKCSVGNLNNDLVFNIRVIFFRRIIVDNHYKDIEYSSSIFRTYETITSGLTDFDIKELINNGQLI